MTRIDLAYDVLGEGPSLVLLHGITENRRSWDPVPLSDHYRVVRVDLRGHGASPGGGPYDLVSLAQDVRAVAERESSGDLPLVVGHSMGGVVATVYASLFPVRAVVNVDQPLALLDVQAQIRPAAPILRGDGFAGFMAALFDQLSGALDPAEAARLSTLRRPDQEAVLGMWAPLLDLEPDELAEVVTTITTLPAGTPYLSLHRLARRRGPGRDGGGLGRRPDALPAPGRSGPVRRARAGPRAHGGRRRRRVTRRRTPFG